MQGKKSNLPLGDSEGSKSIHNGPMIRVRTTAHTEEEQRRGEEEEKRSRGGRDCHRILRKVFLEYSRLTLIRMGQNTWDLFHLILPLLSPLTQ